MTTMALSMKTLLAPNSATGDTSSLVINSISEIKRPCGNCNTEFKKSS
jgi:hypothetical protein